MYLLAIENAPTQPRVAGLRRLLAFGSDFAMQIDEAWPGSSRVCLVRRVVPALREGVFHDEESPFVLVPHIDAIHRLRRQSLDDPDGDGC